MRDRIEAFCATKRITFGSLAALGTRYRLIGKGPDLELAWACPLRPGHPTIVGVKYRNIASGARSTEKQSRLASPILVGNPNATNWVIVEGETDGARWVDLAGDEFRILVLPAGAFTFEKAWADLIPRGATVYLGHDNDESGEKGARKAEQMIGGNCIRLRPPDAVDWCEWDGGREELAELVRNAKDRARAKVKTFDEVLEQYERERSQPEWEPVRLGFGTVDADIRGISPGQVLGFAARTGVGKTWFLASILENFTARDDAGVLVLSLEQPAPEWLERQFAIHAGIATERVEELARECRLSRLASQFLRRMRHARIVEESVNLNGIHGLIAEARIRLDVELRLVLIDYLGLVGGEGKTAYEKASALGLGLKEIAKGENVPIVTAMQLSRAGGDGSEPVTKDMLRDSGVLEESLDFLIGAWQPGIAKDLNPVDREALRDVMCVAILKNRKGRDGRVVDLRFQAESRRVFEPDPFHTDTSPAEQPTADTIVNSRLFDVPPEHKAKHADRVDGDYQPKRGE